MISSRDFVLSVLVLVCIIGGILFTLAREGASGKITFPSEVKEYGVITSDPKYDTNQRLLTLQEKITSGDGLLESAPPVFKSLDQLRAESAAKEAQEASEAAIAALPLSAQYCAGVSGGPLWSGVDEVRMRNNERQFVAIRAVGTTTEQYIKFTLPQRSIRSSFESCIDSTIIGATVTGHPLQNTDVSSYQGSYQGALIGYTRDGFTLYGPVPNPETLDRCGGRYEGGEYRYHVRANASTLISCFAGVPERILITD